MKNSKFGLRVLLLGLVAFAFSFASTVWAGLDRASPLQRIHVSTERFDQWQYDAYREGKQITLEVSLKDTSLAGLDAFRAATQRMAEDLVTIQDTISVNVVLGSPISADDFKQLVARYGLQVSAFQMRAIDGRGARVTLFISPSSQDELVSMPTIDSLLAQSRTETGDAKLLGVISIEASIPSIGLNELAASPYVYLIDVTPTFAKRHFQQQHADLIQEDEVIVVPAHPVYWYLEDSRTTKN